MNKLNDESVAELIKLYEDGVDLQDIASKFGIFKESVSRILRKRGIKKNRHTRLDQKTIDLILSDYDLGLNPTNISKKLNIYDSTIIRVIKKYRPGYERMVQKPVSIEVKVETNKNVELKSVSDIENYGTTYIPSWNNIALKADNLKLMSVEDKKEAAKFLFNFYRERGFPYPILNGTEIIKEFNSLRTLDAGCIFDNNILRIDNRTGTDIFKHFSPHFWEVKSGKDKKKSMLETFLDDDSLLKTIENRLSQNYNMTGNMLKQGLANSKLAFKASSFNTAIAKFIYSKFAKENDIIYDYSVGFGQRLIGALSLPHNITYLGVDVSQRSVDSCNNIYKFLVDNAQIYDKKINLNCIGSEEYCPEEYHGKINLAFSSPPYFNLEKYGNEPNQAYGNDDYIYFLNWWKMTCANIEKLLTSDGKFLLNVKDIVGPFTIGQNMCNIIKSYGFKLDEILQIKLTKNLMFGNTGGEHKYEPIYIFSRVKK